MENKKDDTTLFGILALIFSLIPIVGVVFAIASIRQAKKHHREPIIGWVAILISLYIGVTIGIYTYNNIQKTEKIKIDRETSQKNMERDHIVDIQMCYSIDKTMSPVLREYHCKNLNTYKQ